MFKIEHGAMTKTKMEIERITKASDETHTQQSFSTHEHSNISTTNRN
jgi:hypothetical protein